LTEQKYESEECVTKFQALFIGYQMTLSWHFDISFLCVLKMHILWCPPFMQEAWLL